MRSICNISLTDQNQLHRSILPFFNHSYEIRTIIKHVLQTASRKPEQEPVQEPEREPEQRTKVGSRNRSQLKLTQTEPLIDLSSFTLYLTNGERGHTPSRGALCQYLAGEGPAREAKMCPTAYVLSRRVAVK
jgi:hypothetical protein